MVKVYSLLRELGTTWNNQYSPDIPQNGSGIWSTAQGEGSSFSFVRTALSLLGTHWAYNLTFQMIHLWVIWNTFNTLLKLKSLEVHLSSHVWQLYCSSLLPCCIAANLAYVLWQPLCYVLQISMGVHSFLSMGQLMIFILNVPQRTLPAFS